LSSDTPVQQRFSPENNQFSSITDIGEFKPIIKKQTANKRLWLSLILGYFLERIAEKIKLSSLWRKRIKRVIEGIASGQHRAHFNMHERINFLRRLHNLGVTEDMIRQSKCIVDIGSGVNDFAGYAIRTGLNENVYSIDPDMDPDNVYLEYLSEDERRAINSLAIKACAEDMPLENASADLVIAHDLHFGDTHCCYKSLDNSNIIKGVSAMREYIKRRLDSTFQGMTRILKNDGEIRIYPFNPAMDTGILDALKPIESEGRHRITFEKVPPMENLFEDCHCHLNRDDFRIIIKKQS